ncbi:unnamed protein product [Zymoseptoria tritici ST99CH_1A5]|uniref:Inositol hexakisphosphate and diphosphoinositol-pentakisphosphate kinase n=3 Tax=Zymoseptoria tritici TaxID=1047171 RepID=A0A1X7RLY4_ZYMT9|nr:unnamed protein product [Zymoseptoria tritici ST99CH_3D7]SMR48336.1 unnamed protein product [Zymoseptoria tritici ST99CH_1E4]SMR49422.1 unnamed protein product [Zymoseptoria tritici ST99CH_3D1]SMY22119.1 unnamed protein product [Zymoseptoria tritici ST99CH_1A5]
MADSEDVMAGNGNASPAGGTPRKSTSAAPSSSMIDRRPEPDLESNRMSFSYAGGRASVFASGPSSSAAGSDQDAKLESSDRATTATHTLPVTAQSQNGSLSPQMTNMLGEPSIPAAMSQSSASIASTTTSPASPVQAPNPPAARPARSVRGREPANSRRVSNSGLTSASHSAERSTASTNPNQIGTIGICALDAKARSKPSRNILNRLVGKDNEFDVIIFGDKVILDENVENWPVCDFLISFFSDGFPLEKAIAYAKLRKPFCVNDLPMQTILWDRRMCLGILDKLGVPTPPRLEVNRDGGPVVLTSDIAQRMQQLTGVYLIGSDDGRGGGLPPPNDVHMEDDDDTLVVDGMKLRKPFVEKPTSGEDHNINVYYPKSQGGGGRRLFRKVNNKSSEKDADLIVPRAITEPDGSYIYEQFLKVENAEDVKAYTVGPEFCHAETRKSPVVDGVVKRNPNGKEIRYVTKLTPEEQTMAAKIATGFGQQVCGFDLLRVEGSGKMESYVIDVNGWSFVKDNNDYYDQAARVLKAMFIKEKQRWEAARAAATDFDEASRSMPPPTSVPASIYKNANLSKESVRTAGGHREAMKTILRPRSVSQLRDKVHSAAHRVGHPHRTRSPSAATPPISSPPSLERDLATPQYGPLVATDEQMLPPPAVPANGASADDRPRSAGLESVAMSEPPSALPAPAPKSQWKLKGMVAVIRHADRTPKQKFKFTFHTKPFVDLLKGHQEEVLLVGEAALHSVQQAVRLAMAEGVEDMAKLRTLQNALSKKGAWPGTKVQIKPMFKKPKAKDDKGEKKEKKKDKHSETSAVDGASDQHLAPKPAEEDLALARAQTRNDSLGEITMSRAAAADNNLVLDKLQLVMKWGGEPTHSARYQATDLGENMRNDLLLMNRSVLDNVHIYTSSERRVTTSAQIFAAAFLDEKEVDENRITVRKDLLDDSNAAKDEMDKVKKKLKGLLRQGHQAPEQFAWPKDGTPEPFLVVRRVVDLMKFHRRVMRNNFSKLQGSEAVSSLEKLQKSPIPSASPDPMATPNGLVNGANATDAMALQIQPRWCTGEDAELFKERWEKLFNEFTDAEKVDPSKISELYDTMKFDALHNRQFLEWVFTPSKTILAEEEGADDGAGLERTLSQIAREEFGETHQGLAPMLGPNGEVDTPPLSGPKKADTFKTLESIEQKDKAEPKPKERESKPSFSERLGFRRKSADLLSAASRNGDNGSSDDPSKSYFSLYKGANHANSSKVKNDARLEKLNEMYNLSKILFDFIGPQEYGITNSEKLEIGLLTSLPLLKEIVQDLEEVQASDDARSFLYFTKESHIYTLLNTILEGGVATKIARNAIPELDYLSQICFELYESENPIPIDPTHDGQAGDEEHEHFNYSIRITISPGCHTFDPLDVQLDSKHCIGCAPRRSLTSHGEWKEVLETLRAKFHTVKLPKSFTAVDLRERFSIGGNGSGGAGAEKKQEKEGGKGEVVLPPGMGQEQEVVLPPALL